MKDYWNLWKELWVFVILWKSMSLLIAKKQYEWYAKAILGMLVFVILAIPVFKAKENGWVTEYDEKITKIMSEFGTKKTIFTKEMEVKFKFDEQCEKLQNSVESLEKQGKTEAFDVPDKPKKKEHILTIRKISTENVEKIQINRNNM